MSLHNLKVRNEVGLFNVRQDRVDADPERIKLRISDNEKYGILNYAAFGIAVETSSKLNEEYLDAVVLVDDAPVSILNLRKVREISTNESKQTAYIISGVPLDVDAIQAILGLNTILNERNQKQKQELSLNAMYRLIVLEIRDLLIKLQSDLALIEKDSFELDKSMLDHYEDKISDRVSAHLSQQLAPKYGEIETIFKGMSPEKHAEHLAFFRENVGELMLQSAYAHRAFFKPKGYAGDYEMMNHVYKRETRGKSLFAKCLQRYFVDEPAGRAVRNREEYLRKKLTTCIENFPKQKIKILSVASGPAMEIQNFLSDTELDLSNTEFHLLDQDVDGLKFAQRKIETICREKGIKINLKLHYKSIKTVIEEGLKESDFNLIYSAGLFDYFTDPVAMFAGRQLANALKDNGQLIIGNFSLNNPNQFAMGLIMDWNLIYRSPEQMEKLFKCLGKSYSLEQEPQSINLFAVVMR